MKKQERLTAKDVKLICEADRDRENREKAPLFDEFMGAVTPQEDYCRDCICVNVCNVVLKNGEICGDRAERDKSFKFEYFAGGEFVK